MPPTKGKPQATISHNIAELYDANAAKPAKKKRKRDQIVAIALSEARKSSK